VYVTSVFNTCNCATNHTICANQQTNMPYVYGINLGDASNALAQLKKLVHVTGDKHPTYYQVVPAVHCDGVEFGFFCDDNLAVLYDAPCTNTPTHATHGVVYRSNADCKVLEAMLQHTASKLLGTACHAKLGICAIK
jgi:hypothetical protein